MFHTIIYAATIIKSPTMPFALESAIADMVNANDEPCMASNAFAEKTKDTHTAVYITKKRGYKIRRIAAANEEPHLADTTFVKKSEASRTAVHIIKALGFKPENESAAYGHNAKTCKQCRIGAKPMTVNTYSER
ncbi:hypothetical protein LPJ58_004967, partial [Coemansia sp. RSA 1591]